MIKHLVLFQPAANQPEELREHNLQTRRKTEHFNLIAEREEDISIDLVIRKLEFISRNAEEIAELVG